MKIVKKLRFSVNENWGGGIIIAHQTNLKKKKLKIEVCILFAVWLWAAGIYVAWDISKFILNISNLTTTWIVIQSKRNKNFDTPPLLKRMRILYLGFKRSAMFLLCRSPETPFLYFLPLEHWFEDSYVCLEIFGICWHMLCFYNRILKTLYIVNWQTQW